MSFQKFTNHSEWFQAAKAMGCRIICEDNPKRDWAVDPNDVPETRGIFDFYELPDSDGVGLLADNQDEAALIIQQHFSEIDKSFQDME